MPIDIVMNQFSNAFESPIPSAAEAKAAILSQATADKERRLDPSGELTQKLLRASDANLAVGNAASTQAQSTFDATIGKWLEGSKKIKEAYDPNSETNKGKLYTAAEMSHADPLSIPTAVDALLAVKENATDLAGKVWSVPNEQTAEFYRKQADKPSHDAYAKLLRNEPLSSDEQSILNAHPITGSHYDQYTGGYVDDIHQLSNQELLSRAEKNDATSKKIPGAITSAVEMVTPDSFHSNPARTDYNPGYDIPGGVSDLMHTVQDIPVQTAGAVGNMLNPDADPNHWSNSLVQAAEENAVQRNTTLTENEKRRKVLPLPNSISEDGGLTREDLSETAPNMGFSVASMGATLAGAVVPGAINPVAGVAAGMAASGKAAYNMDKGMITRQLIKTVEQQKGSPLTADERAEFLTQTEDARSNHALWEAGPEAIGNAIAVPLLGKIFKGAEKSAIGKIASSLVLDLGSELGTEATTQIGQSQAENAMGLGDGSELSFTNPQSWKQAIKEVGPGVVALSGLTGGAVGAAGKLSSTDAAIGEIAADQRRQAANEAAKEAPSPVTGADILASVTSKFKAKPEEFAKIDALHKGTAAPDYAKTLEAVVESGDVTPYTDAEHEVYNPLLAVEALAQINKKAESSYETKAANLEEAFKIADDFNAARGERILQQQELEDKYTAKTLTKDDRIRLSYLRQAAEGDREYVSSMYNTIQSMNKTEATAKELKQQLEDAKNNTDPEAVNDTLKQIFGSNGGADLSSLGSGLEALRAGKNKADTQVLLDDIAAYTDSQDKLNSLVMKNTDVVRNDVINGGGQFKGVSAHTKDIQNALQAGNQVFADQQFNKLSAFAERHQQKADTLQKLGDKEKVTIGGKTYTARLGNPGWQNMVTNIAQEADVLNKGVQVAKGIYTLHNKVAPSVRIASPQKVATTVESTPSVKPKAVAAINEQHAVKDYSGLSPEALQSVAANKRKRAAKFPEGNPVRKIIEQEAADLETMAQTATDSKGADPHVKALSKMKTLDETFAYFTQEANRLQQDTVLTPEQKRQELGEVLKKVNVREAELTAKAPAVSQEQKSANDENEQHKLSENKKTSTLERTDSQGVESPIQNGQGETSTFTSSTNTPDVSIESNKESIPSEVVSSVSQEEMDKHFKEGLNAEFNPSEPKKETAPAAVEDKTDRPQTEGEQTKEKSDQSQHKVEVSHGQETSEEKEKNWMLNQELTAVDSEVEANPNDYRQLNMVRHFMVPKQSKKTNLLQSVGSLFTTLGDALKNSRVASLFPGENKPTLDQDAINLLGSMVEYHAKVGREAARIFKAFTASGQEYRYNDPLQYLEINGALPENVLGAMSAVSYKWLATRGKESLFNDTRTIQRILGFKKEDALTPEAYRLLKEAGVAQNMLVESLGRDIYRLLEIQPKNTAPKDFEQRLQTALGMHAVAAMEHANLLKVNYVYSGKFATENKKEGTFGIDALRANIENYYDDSATIYDLTADGAFFANPAIANPEGKQSIRFYQVAPDAHRDVKGFLQPNEEVKQMMESWSKSKGTWDSVFSADEDTQDYSWEPYKVAPELRTKIDKTTQLAMTDQSQNVLTNSNLGWKQSLNTMHVFLSLDQQSQLDAMGYVDPETQHVSDRDATIDTNNSLVRDIDALSDWLQDAQKQKDGLFSIFYIPARIYRNLRMGQKGVINPQNSKLHRYIFGIPAWESTFKIGDQEYENRFMEAVGLSLGVESSKKGGLDEALQATSKKLMDADIQASLRAIQTVLATVKPGETVSPALAQDILAGVKSGGEHIHTLKGLIEYARYTQAKENGDSEFTTDIASEIDGMSNGPIIGKIQLMFNTAIQSFGMLRNGGLSFSAGHNDTGEHLLNRAQMDPYQAGGMAWSEALEDISRNLLAELKQLSKRDTTRTLALKQELSRITAVKRLLGEFNDSEGFVEKLVRSLTKSPVMTTMYGSGEKALIAKLTRTLTEDTIREKLKKISQISDVAQVKRELEKLEYDIHIIANLPKGTQAKHYFLVPSHVTANGKVNAEAILNLEIPKKSLEAIHDHIATGHGKALSLGIDTIYGDIKEGRKDLNLGFVISAALYNAAREHAISSRKEALIQEGKLAIVQQHKNKHGKVLNTDYADLSIEEYTAIDKALANVYPTLGTPFGGKMDMAKQSNDRVYSTDQKVVQSYNSDLIPGSKRKKVQEKTAILADGSKLKSPGVAPMVLAIQSVDATISNLVQGTGLPILNCHDGFFSGINHITEVNQELNKTMYEVMRDYNLVQQMHDSVQGVVDNFNAYRANNPSENWDAEIEKQFAAFDIKIFKQGKEGAVKITDPASVQNEVLTRMQILADTATKNKANLLTYLQNINHYYYPKGGYTIEHGSAPVKKETQEVFDALDATMESDTKTRAENLANLQKTNHAMIEELFKEYVLNTRNENTLPQYVDVAKNSAPVSKTSNKEGLAVTALHSAAEGISLNESDYDIAMRIDQQNAVDTYNQLKNVGTVQDSIEHDSHLQRILFDLIAKVMNPADVFMKTNPKMETLGAIVTEPGGINKIFVSAQTQGATPISGMLAQGIRMSTGEVYTHELIHAITHHGLKLNARLRGQVESLYRIVKENLNTNSEGFRHFLTDPTLNINDRANAFEVAAAKQRWDYIFENPTVKQESKYNSATDLIDTKKYSQHLDEFMAFGLTNEYFVNALKNIATSSYQGKVFTRAGWAGIVGKNIQETMLNILDRLTDMFMHNFTSGVPAANVAAELENLAKRLSEIDTSNKTIAAQVMQRSGEHYQKIATFVNAQVKQAFGKLKLDTIAANATRSMANQNSATGQLLRDWRKRMDGMQYGMLQSIMTEMQGLTDRVFPLHRLLNLRGMVIDRAREEATMQVKDALASLWNRDLNPKEKKAILKGAIKTDLAALRMHFSMDDIYALANPEIDPGEQATALDKAIVETQQQIRVDPVLGAYINYYAKQGQSLGFMMVRGRGLEKVTLLNAWLIGSLSNTKFKNALDETAINRAEELIDKLASMYALKFTPATYRRDLRSLMSENMNAVESILQLHQDLQLHSQYALFDENPNKIIKGYTKEIVNPLIKIVVAPLAQESALREQGYTRSNEMLPRDSQDPDTEPMYLYTSRTGNTNDWLSGIASLTSNRAKGTNPMQNAQKQGYDSMVGLLDNAEIIQAKTDSLNEMFDTAMVPYDANTTYGNRMVPQVDDRGNIIKYRYMMSESTKDSLLEKHNEYDDVLGAMAGQIPDKTGTKLINERLIHALKDVYDAEYDDRHSLYVEISPYALEQRHREIYHMLPAKTKQQIKAVWGSDKMLVAKDIIDLAFGYRKYSLTEAFSKTEADRSFFEKAVVQFAQEFFGDKKIVRVHQIDELLKGMTRIAKNNIIVKSFKITLGNHISNLMLCKGKGVSYINMIKWKREASVGAIKYQADKKALNEAEIKLQINNGLVPGQQLSKAAIEIRSKNLKAKIRELNNSIALNPVTELMTSGVMQSIVDDVETGGVQSPYPGMIETQAEKLANYLPMPLVNMGKVLLLTEDTQAYKLLNNMTKMTDFVGRYIMYKHYTDPTRGKDRLGYADAIAHGAKQEKYIASFIHDRAVAQVMHDFINFNLPTHRVIQALNDMGLVWFSKYSLRVLKPIKDMIQDKPFEAITSFTLAHALGASSVWDSVPFISKRPLSVFGDPLSAFIKSGDDAITMSAAEALAGIVIP